MIKPPDSSVSRVGAAAPSQPVERLRGELGRLLVAVESAAAKAPIFVLGETVTARFVEPLRNGPWVAVIKNTVFTLQLPAAAADAGAPTGLSLARGDTLTLQVATLSPRLSFTVAGSAPAAPAVGAVAVQLSEAAQALSQLVQLGERAAPPTRIAPADTAPVLMSNPSAPPAERAQALAQAIGHSGLFYESHLLAWAEGRLSQHSLGAEPQARIAQALKDGSAASREAASAELGGVLQRQLDALDGRPLAFAGFAWPGQAAAWHIQRDERDPPGKDKESDDTANPRRGDVGESTAAWSTQIDLQLPRLGALGAQVRVRGTEVQLRLTLDDAAAGLAASHRERLASALHAAGLTLAGWAVQAPDDPHGHHGQAEAR